MLIAVALGALFVIASGPARAQDGARGVEQMLGFMTDPGRLSSAHASLDGDCSACHTPTKGADAGKCIACHANESVLIGRQPTAFHAELTRCSGCHAEHLGRDRRPTIMSHEALAVAIAREAGQSPAAVRLRTRPARELERTLDCSRCHSNQDPHRGLFGSACVDCHGTVAWKIDGYRHPSPESRDCVQCHVAPPSHYMMHFEMVSEKAVGLDHVDVRHCHLCHQTTAWNDIRGVGWIKHH